MKEAKENRWVSNSLSPNPLSSNFDYIKSSGNKVKKRVSRCKKLFLTPLHLTNKYGDNYINEISIGNLD